MPKNDLPSEDSIRLAREAVNQFDPPLHVVAGVTEIEIATIIAVYIEEGALVRDAGGRFMVPPHMMEAVANQPILAAMMLGKAAGSA